MQELCFGWATNAVKLHTKGAGRDTTNSTTFEQLPQLCRESMLKAATLVSHPFHAQDQEPSTACAKNCLHYSEVILEKRDSRKVGQREGNKHVKYAVYCWWSRIKRQLKNRGKAKVRYI